jgi:hypothetical protein
MSLEVTVAVKFVESGQFELAQRFSSELRPAYPEPISSQIVVPGSSGLAPGLHLVLQP